MSDKIEDRGNLELAIKDATRLVDKEMRNAMVRWGRYNSLHEAYAVIAEELDELWEVVRQKREERDLVDIEREAMHIAATAMRLLVETTQARWEDEA